MHSDRRSQHGEFYTFFTHLFSWTDISDHKGGVLLLTANLVMGAAITWQSRLVAVQLGGAKRLHALVTSTEAALLTPWALYHWKDLVRRSKSF